MKLVKNTNENKIIDTIESTKLGLKLATSTLIGGRFERLNYNSKKTFFLFFFFQGTNSKKTRRIASFFLLLLLLIDFHLNHLILPCRNCQTKKKKKTSCDNILHCDGVILIRNH